MDVDRIFAELAREREELLGYLALASAAAEGVLRSSVQWCSARW